eukprot:GHVN01083935.1.p1 GENE.GHVN01083935.1~~GHVN01083935.1.p1  ORF type:complete len:381 (+),score=32.57 GHVN01083935.1:62-1204(+)
MLANGRSGDFTDKNKLKTRIELYTPKDDACEIKKGLSAAPALPAQRPPARTPSTNKIYKTVTEVQRIVSRAVGLCTVSDVFILRLPWLGHVRLLRKHTEADIYTLLGLKDPGYEQESNAQAVKRIFSLGQKDTKKDILLDAESQKKRNAALAMIFNILLVDGHYSLETAFLAIHYFDIFSTKKTFSTQKAALTCAAACCLLSGKILEEETEPGIGRIAETVRFVLKESMRRAPSEERLRTEICALEQQIIQRLGWSLSPVTPAMTARHLLKTLPMNTTEIEGFLLLYSEIFTALALFSSKSFLLKKYAGSEIAAVSLVLVFEQNILLTPFWREWMSAETGLSLARFGQIEASLRECLQGLTLIPQEICSVTENNFWREWH